MTVRPRTVEIFPSGEIGVAWDDGAESFLGARALRIACPCAECVDELTGVARLDPARVPATVRAQSWTPVGHYAVQFVWSDGHRSGIYTFEHLRRLSGAH